MQENNKVDGLLDHFISFLERNGEKGSFQRGFHKNARSEQDFKKTDYFFLKKYSFRKA